MTLGEKQRLFTKLVALLVLHAYELGYELTFGEAWRSPEEAARLAQTGHGIERSLHSDRLAIDLNLFFEGRWLTQTADFTDLGGWWKAQHELCRWGGDFTKPDGNHFSLTHEGRS